MAEDIESVDDTPIEQIDAAIDATPQLPGFAAPIQAPLSEAFALDESGQIEVVRPADVSVLSDSSQIGDVLKDCASLISDIQGVLKASIDACFATCSGVAVDCKSCIESAVNSAAQSANAIRDKCGQGIATRWAVLLTDAYGRLEQLGQSSAAQSEPVNSIVEGQLPRLPPPDCNIPAGALWIDPARQDVVDQYIGNRQYDSSPTRSYNWPTGCLYYRRYSDAELETIRATRTGEIELPICRPSGLIPVGQDQFVRQNGPGEFGLPCGFGTYYLNGAVTGQPSYVYVGDPCNVNIDRQIFPVPECKPGQTPAAPVETPATPTAPTQCTGPNCQGCSVCATAVVNGTENADLNVKFPSACDPDGVVSLVNSTDVSMQIDEIGKLLGMVEGQLPQSFLSSFDNTKVLSWALKTVSAPIQYLVSLASWAAKQSGIITGCNIASATAASSVYAVVNLVQKWTGSLIPAAVAYTEYQANAHCQYVIPGPPELDALRRGEWITKEQWEAAQKIQGVCIPWRDQIYELQQSRPDAFQYAQLRRRELIDKDTYDQQLKVLGYMQEKTRQDVYDLTEQIPGSSDIIRFMLRDVADEQVVQTYGYDDEFEDKFTGRLKDWAAWQGVSEEAMRFFWRAHWEIPSATQLYEMLHRLRPDRPKMGGDYDHIDVTPEIVEAALKVNDLAPTWVEPIMAISYRPLTRVDVRRMACMGVLKGDDVTEAYRDLGYSKDDAKKLAEFTRLTNAGSTCAESIGLTRSQILSLYKTDGIDRDTASQWLQSLGYESATVDSFLTGVERLRDAARRNAEVVALRKRFAMGDLTQKETVAELVSIGLAVDQAQNLAAHWDRLRRYKRKEGTVAQLCEWFQRGLMTIDTYQTRLLNLGYSSQDTIRIIDTCFLKNVEKLQKEAERKKKELEQLIKDQEKRREDARKRAAAARASLPKPSRNGIGQ